MAFYVFQAKITVFQEFGAERHRAAGTDRTFHRSGQGSCWAISEHPNGRSVVRSGQWKGTTCSDERDMEIGSVKE
ncbi:hypothetical protein BSK33_07015 [Geobacillus sp. 44B]|nr:hypothetical protein BSK33_07015 [Geobacillus sp. 44B]